MAESRRVHLTTLSSDAPPSSHQPGPAHTSPSSGGLQGTETRPADTVRLVLALFEPDERNFSEFSYTQLLDKKVNNTKDKVLLNKSDTENDEVAAIAKKLEEKYGGKPKKKKKKKKDRIQDLIDIGYGYDEEDSFIDNSEAYDEFVPASITTKYGGFYVNSGVLQFRQTSDTEAEDIAPEETTLDPSKKRKLNGGQDKPRKKPCNTIGERKRKSMEPKSSTLSELGPNDEMKRKKKKKKAVGTLSVTSMLKKFQREKEKEQQRVEKVAPKAAGMFGVPTIPLCPADAAGGGGSGLTDPLLSLIGSTNDHALFQAASTVDLDIDLVSLLEASEETFSPKLVPQPDTETQLFQPKTNNHTQCGAAPAQPPNTKTNSQPKIYPEQIQLLSETSAASPHGSVPLPEGLTPGLEDDVRKLMKVAKTSEGESKLKFFTPEINSILLDIELRCREQGAGQLRSKLYTHLSSFLPCSKDTLLKRVRKLLLTHTEEPPDAGDPVWRLKEAIAKVMPEQIACHQASCQAYEQVKASKTTEEGSEGKQDANVGPEDDVEGRGVRRGGPKKLFKWNEEIREHLRHVLRPKMDRCKQEMKGSQETEEYLKTLLDTEVKPLWPKGWMQSRTLLRESRKLGFFTSLPAKKARSDKRQSSISGASTVSDVLQGAPPLDGDLPRGTDDALTDSSNVSSSVSRAAARNEAAVLRTVEAKKGGGLTVDACSSPPTESGVPLGNAAPAPTHLLLNLLADQALAQEQPLAVSQELLAAAVARYKCSRRHWSLEADPPLPPPPPQSSPVGFPVTMACQIVLPQLLHTGDFCRPVDADQVLVISDDSDTSIK